MASQVTHIVYASFIKQKFFLEREFDLKKYYIGNVFPDIRYLGVISRDLTHFKDPIISEMKKFKDPFQLGMYAHSLIDWEREKCLNKLGLYEILEKDRLNTLALKLLEDEMNYRLFDNWKQIAAYLDDVLQEESMVPLESAKRWHNLLQDYFLKKKTALDLAEKVGIQTEIMNHLGERIEFLKRNEKVVRIIEETPRTLFG